MKRKVFLALIPALMVLSSCSGINLKDEKKDVVPFVEDTLAHDELFGQGTGSFRQVRNIVNPDSSIPTLGMQVSTPSAGKFSIRFVAAVSLGELASASAVWTRTIFDGSGYAYVDENTWESKGAYTKLKDGEDTIDISSFAGCDHFVVYTIKDIPESTYNSYYINVSLSVNGGASSKVLATTVDRTTQFTFDIGETGYFGVKKTATGFETFARASYAGGNEAQFEGISVGANESFIIVNRYIAPDRANKHTDFFAVHGYDKVRIGDPAYAEHDNGYYGFTQVGSSQFAKSPSNNEYFFYLNDALNIYINYSKTYYLAPTATWNHSNARFAICISENSTQRWYSMSETADEGIFSCNVAYSNSENVNYLILCRMNGATSENNWGNKWNQTGNQDWQDVNNLFTITGGEGDGYYGTWSVK